MRRGIAPAPMRRATWSAGTGCAGTPNGQAQLLSYDAKGRMLTWQNAASAPTSTASYAYDGSGQRVQQTVTSGGVTTTTTYVGAYEEVSVTGTTTTTTQYYAAGMTTAVSVNGTLSYLVHDTLGSVAMAVDNSGTVTASQLYDPYGATRYATGTMPTAMGFTGQRQDPSGLQYFNARYYDPTAGQFASADWVQGPNRYAYVGDNPTTRTDPKGTCWPLCTVLLGALVGAVVGAGSSIVSQAVTGQPINWGEVGKQALVGAATGAISGLVGPEAGLAVHAVVGGVSAAGGSILNNRRGTADRLESGGDAGRDRRGDGGLRRRGGECGGRGRDEDRGAAIRAQPGGFGHPVWQ